MEFKYFYSHIYSILINIYQLTISRITYNRSHFVILFFFSSSTQLQNIFEERNYTHLTKKEKKTQQFNKIVSKWYRNEILKEKKKKAR